MLEITYQYSLRKDVPLNGSNNLGLISIQEYHKMLEAGCKLVLLDDLVLDIRSFMKSHPGGKFVLKHNIGRDVSKFFHGGHTLENIKYVAPHTHSNAAKKIANKLAIARLVTDERVPLRYMKIDGVERETNTTGSCQTIKFRNVAEDELKQSMT